VLRRIARGRSRYAVPPSAPRMPLREDLLASTIDLSCLRGLSLMRSFEGAWSSKS